jgi:Ni,Fe-hydrogenase III small subunit
MPPRPLFVRHLDCGSCNGCELELNALRNPVYDIAKDGIVFEPFPRQASVLVVTGVYTRNLAEIAAAAYDAMPEPRRVLLVGDCAKDGGVFTHSYAVNAWPATLAQIDTCHVAGCPPAPEDIRKALIELR